MLKNFLVVCTLVTAVSVACGGPPQAPTSPSAALPAASTGADSDTVTLKASAPTPTSPINNTKVDSSKPTLTINNAAASYVIVTLLHRFQVFDASGTLVIDSGPVTSSGGTTAYTLAVDLVADKTYTWRARAEYDGHNGPWSSTASFVTPDLAGYIRGAELYDPLIDGKTVGQVHGAVQFIPGVGVKLLEWTAYISYELPQTLLEGEYSLIVTNMPANTKGDKQKIMAMAEGYDEIIENDRRMTVEKRGDPPGVIAWRFLTHHDRIETEGAERVAYDFQANRDYFVQATWRGNFFNVLFKEGGVNGVTIYSMGKPWDGDPYDPTPHVIYLGAPVGRSGPSAASIENTIYRQVWVSARPRPASAK
jgi:hypothetical protein